MTPPSLRIGLPVYDAVPAQCLASILSVSDWGSWQIVRGTYIDRARNQIMESFTEDLLLFLDADMVFEPQQARDLLKRLMKHPEHGALSGHYIMRDGSGLPVCDWRDTEDGSKWMPDDARAKKATRLTGSGGVHRVDSFGSGFLAVTQEAKRRVGPPWFKMTQEGEDEAMGEDAFFCQRLIREGFRPAVHFGIVVGHCGYTVYRP